MHIILTCNVERRKKCSERKKYLNTTEDERDQTRKYDFNYFDCNAKKKTIEGIITLLNEVFDSCLIYSIVVDKLIKDL